MYSTRLHVYTRASLTDILARKSARVGQVGVDRRAVRVVACGHTDFPREDPRAEVGEDVRDGVGPMEFQLTQLAAEEQPAKLSLSQRNAATAIHCSCETAVLCMQLA